MLSARRKAQLGLCSALLVLGLCFCALIAGTFFAEPIPFAEVGVDAPQFTLPNTDGANVQLSDFSGKTIVLCFGSTRCPKTNDYSARVASLARQYSADPRVQFIAVNVSSTPVDPAEVRVDARLTERNFPTLIDDRGRVADMFSAANTPQFVVIDSRGVVSYRGAFDDNTDPKRVTHEFCREVLASLIGSPANPAVATAAK